VNMFKKEEWKEAVDAEYFWKVGMVAEEQANEINVLLDEFKHYIKILYPPKYPPKYPSEYDLEDL